MLGAFLRDVIVRNPENFRVFGPDETASNRLGAVFEATARQWEAETLPTDEGLAPEGRVMEVLSEHLCQGWLEGYLLDRPARPLQLLRGVHPHHRLDVQPAREVAEGDARNPVAPAARVAELPPLVARLAPGPQRVLASGPGFIDHVVNKKAEVIRVYLPPDANTLLSVADHCLRSRHYVNVIVAGKQPALDYLSMEDAIVHCTRGLGIWDWASTDDGARAGRRARLRRRRPDPRDARRRRDPARAAPRPEGARRQRRRPDAAPAGERAPARPPGRRVRLAVHAPTGRSSSPTTATRG